MKKNVVVSPVTPEPSAPAPTPTETTAPTETPEEAVSTETALENPEVTTPTEEVPALNSAGEEETVITAEQTKTQTGPVLWITLLLAFVFASAWNAWQKQKG